MFEEKKTSDDPNMIYILTKLIEIHQIIKKAKTKVSHDSGGVNYSSPIRTHEIIPDTLPTHK